MAKKKPTATIQVSPDVAATLRIVAAYEEVTIQAVADEILRPALAKREVEGAARREQVRKQVDDGASGDPPKKKGGKP